MKKNPSRRRSAALATMLAVLAVLMSSCGYNVPGDMVAVQVGGGPFEAKKIKGCKNPADRGFWTNDDYRYFPTSQRDWDATGQKGADSDPFKSITKDSVEMWVPVVIRFTLKTDCDTLKDFYARYARRDGVEFKNDGTFEETGKNYNKAWLTTLRKLVADPADSTVDRIIQGYSWRDVWKNPATKAEIEKALDDQLSSETSLLLQVTDGRKYFEGISVIVKQPQPVKTELSDAVALEQTNIAKAQSAEAQARAETQQALAEVAKSRAEAEKQRATINGFRLPGMSSKDALLAYNQAQLIAAGGNPFQPTYLYGGAPGPQQ